MPFSSNLSRGIFLISFSYFSWLIHYFLILFSWVHFSYALMCIPKCFCHKKNLWWKILLVWKCLFFPSHSWMAISLGREFQVGSCKGIFLLRICPSFLTEVSTLSVIVVALWKMCLSPPCCSWTSQWLILGFRSFTICSLTRFVLLTPVNMHHIYSIRIFVFLSWNILSYQLSEYHILSNFSF